MSSATISTKNELARITAKINQLKKKYPTYSQSEEEFFSLGPTKNTRIDIKQQEVSGKKVL